MKSYKNINVCRLCKSTQLKEVIKFGKVPLGNDFKNNESLAKKANTFNLKLNRCTNCQHFQLSISVNPKLLYATNYTYLSGIGKKFIDHFKNYHKWIIKKTKLPNDSLIVDIGSNDGTCLNNFKKNFRVCGVDMAKLPVEIANQNNVFTYLSPFNKKIVKKIKNKFGSADLITSHNVLAHIEDSNNVFDSIYDLLKLNGYFCFEVGYFKEVLKNNYFDTIYHEHLDYHTANPLVKFLLKKNFSIKLINTNNIQGGSLRILCQKKNNITVSKQVTNFLINEKKSQYLKNRFLNNWKLKIFSEISKTRNHINRLGNNINLIGYGAPTKTILLLKISKINSKKIKYIIEDNIHKTNKFLPKSAIKVVSTTRIRNSDNNMIIIFAWNFSSDIVNNLNKLNIKNTKVIIPLPKFKIVKL